MRIVLDTNVLISGIFFSGPPSQILKAWQEDKIQIVVSEDILIEYQRVAEELSKKFPEIDIEQILELFTIYAEIVDTSGLEVTVCEDPDDNMFISCALAGKSKIIVSGDKHLLKISGYQKIKVLKPRDFLDNYQI
ncbi:MAG: putative toxin-antitoxin system toxin component, PIN family [Desulfobulbaceae bacterium]|nr:putative toxin-antitoxin system toxin component, PIN family [Desulfobulbaceae bacterium]